eukprot:4248818-Alexandrium_andersonii.AAC.1
MQAAQRVANVAVRRAMGMDCQMMTQLDATDAQLYAAAGWESMRELIERQTMVWVGHVARMPLHRLPKQ